MLGMAFFKSLVKSHGKEFFEPIGRLLFEAGIKSPNLAKPAHLWLLRRPLTAYAQWWVGMRMLGRAREQFQGLPANLRRYASFACDFLSEQGLEISATMRTHQLKLADRQCSMIDLSRRLQDAVVILVTSLYGAKQTDEVTRLACEVVCAQLYRNLQGQRSNQRDWRKITELGATLAENPWSELAGIEPNPIMMEYRR
jgi:hypothetical protein